VGVNLYPVDSGIYPGGGRGSPWDRNHCLWVGIGDLSPKVAFLRGKRAPPPINSMALWGWGGPLFYCWRGLRLVSEPYDR
jgi:hypothetical protein